MAGHPAPDAAATGRGRPGPARRSRSAGSARPPGPAGRQRHAAAAYPWASRGRRRRDGPAAQRPIPAGSACGPLSAQSVAASMSSSAGISVAMHSAGSSVRNKREHGLLHPLRQPGGRTSGGQHAIRLVGHRPGMGAFLCQHGRHVVGKLLAMQPLRRVKHAVHLGIFGKPARIGAQERGHFVRLERVRRHAGRRGGLIPTARVSTKCVMPRPTLFTSLQAPAPDRKRGCGVVAVSVRWAVRLRRAGWHGREAGRPGAGAAEPPGRGGGWYGTSPSAIPCRSPS